MLKKQAKEITGGLSNPSKMPCKSYSLPAENCKTGSKLRLIAGSVCSNCYACKGCYAWSNTQKALRKRLDSLDNSLWVDAMVTLIGNDPFFRWHDSGDIQSIGHLAMIIQVCHRTPDTKHWLPTKEKKLIKQWLKSNELPNNLTVRLSAAMVDGQPPQVAVDFNRFLSTSTSHSKTPIGTECEAYKNGNECGDCRKCWDKSVQNISYKLH